MKKFDKVLSLIFVLVLMFAGCGNTEDESNEFRVGMECGFAPYNWIQDNETEYSWPVEGGGYADGYDVQIAKLIADRLGKKLVICKTEWDGLTMSVNSGKIDAIIAGMSPTAERKETIDFTDYYCIYTYGMIVRKDSELANAKSLNDFAGYKINGQLNTVLYDLIDQIPDANKVQAADSVPTLVVQANSGAIDGFVCESFGGYVIENTNPDLVYISFDEENGFKCKLDDRAVSIGVKKGSKLVSELNSILSELDQDKMDELMNGAIERQPVETVE